MTLVAYCGLMVIGATRHEPWADEAHAWVLSRGLPYRYLVFHQLAYEGHPPLWATILWVANHWFHAPYPALGWIAAVCAIAGAWFFCEYSPFPTWIRVLFPFTYFLAFQYAIVARPYVLLPLSCFAAAHCFADVRRRPWRLVVATSMLALLCAPGLMISLGLMAARAWYVFREWNEVSRSERKRLVAAALAFVVVLAFVAFVNWPPADRSNAPSVRLPDDPTFGFKFIPRDISLAYLGSILPSAAFVLALGVWCVCRGRLLPFLLPTTLVIAFFVKVYANLWHCGALTLIVVVALWIAWPMEGKCSPTLQRAVNVPLLVGLVAMMSIQIYWTAHTVMMDYSRPYSGSLDAANFLRSVGANRDSTCGFGFHSVAVQAYFGESIFKNWPDGESFWRFELGNRNNQNCQDPEWLVMPICCSFDQSRRDFTAQDRYFRSSGYSPVHFSPGSMFFEGREAEPTDFVIYRRTH